MAKLFICDKCGNQFGGPLDEVSYTNEHGVTTIYDLCAPCRQDLEKVKSQGENKFFAKIGGNK